jgi:hypothetical protein
MRAVAVRYLGEPWRKSRVFALLAVIGGIVLIVLGVPESDEQLSVHHLLSDDFYFAPRAWSYMLSLVPLITVFVYVLQPLCHVQHGEHQRAPPRRAAHQTL